jgi:drug/metabolite transporter (DMT)-like permease
VTLTIGFLSFYQSLEDARLLQATVGLGLVPILMSIFSYFILKDDTTVCTDFVALFFGLIGIACLFHGYSSD